jgi:hypothetical protein
VWHRLLKLSAEGALTVRSCRSLQCTSGRWPTAKGQLEQPLLYHLEYSQAMHALLVYLAVLYAYHPVHGSILWFLCTGVLRLTSLK